MSLIALTAETAATSDAEAVFPPFNPEYWESQAFWLVVSFAILYLVLSRFILPRMASTMEKRGTRIAKDLDEAARLNDEAEEAQQALQVEMAKARSQARETAAEAQAKIESQISAETSAADEKIAAKLGEAEAKISAMRAEALSNVENIAAQTAEAMASRLGLKVSGADATKAVKSVLDAR
ncbi:MAG: hypothetical protein AAF216_00885 [Pseudomonadota bacterium]